MKNHKNHFSKGWIEAFMDAKKRTRENWNKFFKFNNRIKLLFITTYKDAITAVREEKEVAQWQQGDPQTGY